MVSMKIQKDNSPKIEMMGEQQSVPQYPYGLCITLEDDALQKLGLSKLPVVGSKINIQAVCEVNAVSQYDNKDGSKRRSISLQITDMEMVKEKKAEVKASDLYEEKQPKVIEE